MSKSSGGVLLLLVALLLAANAWLATGAIAPLRDAQPLEFVVQLPSLRMLAVYALVSAAAIAALLRLARGRAGLLGPLLILVFPLCAAGLLATPFAGVAPPWLHLFVDLRWWFLGAVAVLQILALRVDFGRSHEPVPGRQTAIPGRRQGILEAALVAVVVVMALVSSPVMRFQSVVVGDEPKYLRFAENWYQGHGVEAPEGAVMIRVLSVACAVLAGPCVLQWIALRAIKRDLATVNYGAAVKAFEARRDEVGRVIAWREADAGLTERGKLVGESCPNGRLNVAAVQDHVVAAYVYLRSRTAGASEVEARQRIVDAMDVGRRSE
jgi:hypothetical protein